MTTGQAAAESRADSLKVRIAARETLADGIISLRLVAAGGGPLPTFEAGAHIDVFVTPELVRQYSLCNDPADPTSYRLAVLLEPNSRGGSREIHRGFAAGGEILVSRPRNNFPLDEAAPRSLLLAGGIGITPLLAMAYRLDRLGRDFSLHYCARSRASAAFLSEISRAPFADRARSHFDDEAPSQRLDFDALLRAGVGETHLYVCGPRGFMDAVVAKAGAAGWPQERIHLEHFSAAPDAAGDAFTVVAARSGKTVEVPADKTIAQALRGAGIDSLLSCEQGVCGTCLTAVLDGVPDHRDLIQSEEEKAANSQIAVCCSRAKTKTLVLDI